jgi:hypothetical protein
VGKPQVLIAAVAATLATHDRAADARFIASLEAIVRANLPRCEPVSDRPGEGLIASLRCSPP